MAREHPTTFSNPFQLPTTDYGGTQTAIKQIVSLASFAINLKRAEKALQNNERRLQALIQNGLDYISLLDAKGNLLWESPSSMNMLGYHFNEFLGKNLFEITHQVDQEWVSRQFAEVAREPGASRSGIFRLGRIDGSWRWVEAIVSNSLSDPAVGAIVVNYRDITERKQSGERILATLEEKEILLREVHHRVKNNLQVMIALIKMRNNSTQDEGTRQFLKELEGQARTMSLVYEQLYQAENLSQVSMDGYLRQLTSNVLDTFGSRNAIQLTVEASLMLDVAKAMPCGLIVNELLSNILKHAFPPGSQNAPAVIISMRLEGETCHLTVSDNGIGLPPGLNWKSGQSMGLHLVDLWATHQLGGTIHVTSETGTTFAIAFDLRG